MWKPHYGALTLCRVGLPSTCRAIKKTTTSRTLGFERTCPRPQKKIHKINLFTVSLPSSDRSHRAHTGCWTCFYRLHRPDWLLLKILAVSIPGPYRVSNVCTGFVAATYQSLSVPSPLGASCERVPGLLTFMTRTQPAYNPLQTVDFFLPVHHRSVTGYERVVNVFIQCDRFHNVFIPSSYRSTPSSCRLLAAGASRPKFWTCPKLSPGPTGCK